MSKVIGPEEEKIKGVEVKVNYAFFSVRPHHRASQADSSTNW